MINSITKPEILAPCGSYEILIAAVKAGADACYIGGNRFSARAYATNLMDDDVARAIDYAHLHDTKLYLTVNTLFKNNEIHELVDYLKPYYKAGLDAVIVQDLGVFSVIQKYFPELPIHCSTQMNINSVHAAAMMKGQGATRIVTAREMSLNEIHKIKETIDIEVETFVHGAMCYSYSGQCLMSSLAGGRSGNRGRCAQPCRKCYDNQYILSMKDMCTLPNLPAIIHAGIDSLKIEGRMKNAYYVASAVDAYRELSMDVIDNRFDEKKAIDYQKKLADIFNRGGFTEGYFFLHNGENMISRTRPNNQGTYVGSVRKIADGKINLSLCEKLYKGDVLEIPLKDGSFVEITTACAYNEGQSVSLAAPKTRYITKDAKVFRTRCNERLSEIDNRILNSKNTKNISIKFKARIGEPLSIAVFDNTKKCITITDDVVEQSNNRMLDIEQIRSKISQLGDTEYVLNELLIDADEAAFVPMSKVKHLRRAVLEKYEESICEVYRRDISDIEYVSHEFSLKHNALLEGYIVFVQTLEQLKAVCEHEKLNNICMDTSTYEKACQDASIRSLIASKDIFISLPYIIDSHFDLEGYLPKTTIRGIYIRNIDGFACVYNKYKEHKLPNDLIMIGAASLYAYNDYAIAYWQSLIPELILEASYELNNKELVEITSKPQIALAYGHQQVMLSAQCVRKSKHSCNHNYDTFVIEDDKANQFYVKCMCDQCFNVIYNGRAYCMLAKEQELLQATGAKVLGISLTIEDYNQSKEALRFIDDKTLIQESTKLFTNGHFYRGVE